MRGGGICNIIWYIPIVDFFKRFSTMSTRVYEKMNKNKRRRMIFTRVAAMVVDGDFGVPTMRMQTQSITKTN